MTKKKYNSFGTVMTCPIIVDVRVKKKKNFKKGGSHLSIKNIFSKKKKNASVPLNRQVKMCLKAS
ncbi:hypothetical protein BsIDN1_51150 [Bacillus safensis]|uniref:Uncharacterized protein n=1 Tax=Bacillus safensis TaxID=561879 RepID=A0A5S9MDF3_BACIA|nr:hypothetical protein BsIDN1_51150 [Bacillus safensis]